MSSIKIFVTNTFLKEYNKECLNFKLIIDQEIHTFQRRYTSSKNNSIILHYDSIEGISKGGKIREIELGGGSRMAAYWDNGELTLLRYGSHEIVGTIKDLNIKKLLENRIPAPNHFYISNKSPLLNISEDRDYYIYKDELSKNWIYCLDDQQNKIVNEIFEKSIDYLEDKISNPRLYYIVGGPGTGKTTILLELLKLFTDMKPYTISFKISEEMRIFIHKWIPLLNLSKFIRNDSDNYDIVLVDDPHDFEVIRTESVNNKNSKSKITVIAFDPLQLLDQVSDNEFKKTKKENSAKLYEISTCYRQKENVGKSTKIFSDMIAKSTPYLEKGKVENYHIQHKELTYLANNLTFVNPTGYVANPKISATENDLENEMKRINNQVGGLWTNSPPLLIAIIDKKISALPKNYLNVLIRYNIEYDIVLPNQLEKIKGLEYQHGIIILSNELYEEMVQGFSGTGRNIYNERRLMRIPLSRAKDSIALLCINIISTHSTTSGLPHRISKKSQDESIIIKFEL